MVNTAERAGSTAAARGDQADGRLQVLYRFENLLTMA